MSEAWDLEQIYNALAAWDKQRQNSTRRILELEHQVQDASQERQRALDTLLAGLGLTNTGTLQQVIEEALRVTEARIAKAGHAAELLQVEIGGLRAHIAALEAERDQANVSLTTALELPPARSRNLASVVVEAVNLVNESKRIIQENLRA